MEATKRRAWIKNVAIIFLVILLLLTFFSNTILNYSLPEVSAQYARYDSIANAIKVSGTVKANESFAVIYDEADKDSGVSNPGQTRKVVSVYVKQGTEVAIGDPILALEGGASKELDEAEKKLRDLEKQYALDQLNDTISDLTTDKSKTESLNTLNKSYKQLAELKELYAAVQAGTDPTDMLKEQKKAAQKEAESIQKQLEEINNKISETKGKINQAESGIEEDFLTDKTLSERYADAAAEYEALSREYEQLRAQADALQAQYDNASAVSEDVQKAYTISQQIKTLTETLNDQNKQLTRLQEDSIIGEYQNKLSARDSAKAALEAYEAANGNSGEEWSFLSAQLTVAERELSEAQAAYEAMLEKGAYGDLQTSRQVEDLLEQISDTRYQIAEAYAKLEILGQPYIDNLTDYYVNNNTGALEEELADAKAALDSVTADYEKAKAEYESLAKQMKNAGIVSENEVLLEVFEKDLETYKERLEAVNERIAEIEEDIQDAAADSRDPEELKERIDELTASISTMEMQMKIDAVTSQKNDTETSYSREDQAKEIAELKADIEAMKNAPSETIVTAPIAGKIVEVNFVPGNSITSGAEVTRIEVADKGYICEVSMSTEEARKIQVGAECSIVNSWWYSDIDAVVSQIRSDPQSQGKNRIVVINVQGDVYEGQSLNFSIGDKSQSYDTVLPNSAIREDSEGKFVLVVESKNTPLSVRYTARRMNIEIIASDDTKSAVSGLYGSEFVVTSATSPISDGQQVRLAEN